MAAVEPIMIISRFQNILKLKRMSAIRFCFRFMMRLRYSVLSKEDFFPEVLSLVENYVSIYGIATKQS